MTSLWGPLTAADVFHDSDDCLLKNVCDDNGIAPPYCNRCADTGVAPSGTRVWLGGRL